MQAPRISGAACCASVKEMHKNCTMVTVQSGRYGTAGVFLKRARISNSPKGSAALEGHDDHGRLHAVALVIVRVPLLSRPCRLARVLIGANLDVRYMHGLRRCS